jgi:hypothetical protein
MKLFLWVYLFLVISPRCFTVSVTHPRQGARKLDSAKCYEGDSSGCERRGWLRFVNNIPAIRRFLSPDTGEEGRKCNKRSLKKLGKVGYSMRRHPAMGDAGAKKSSSRLLVRIMCKTNFLVVALQVMLLRYFLVE